MNTLYAGIGELVVSKSAQDELKTMALGSCVGVILLDPVNRIAGLVHVALPEASINPERAQRKPGSFADTAIPALLAEVRRLGWNGQSRVIIKLAGGATILDANNTFNIGKRNLLAVRKALWEHRLAPLAEETGDSISRTVVVSIATGKVRISTPGREDHYL
ncbi:MAG: chemotaxis protein CheD [Candidatus Delongbacteria bacterium]